jgi:hypothetical protein
MGYKIISKESDFEDAFCTHQNFEKVNFLRELKEQFIQGLSKHYISMGIIEWHGIIIPRKKYFIFKRYNYK